MRVTLKGVHCVRKRLAGGSIAVYFYAWRGGPRLEGLPGSVEFLASFSASCSPRVPRCGPDFVSVLDAFQDSDAFLSLAPRTQADYRKHLCVITAEFGDYRLRWLPGDCARLRGTLLGWRDGLAKRSRRQADYAWSVLARVFSWGVDRGLIAANPCVRGGKLYHGSRADCVWTDGDEAAFMRAASAPLRLALMLALWTGQRQGDLLRLPWSAYDGKVIRLRQSKTGARVAVPVGAPLKAMLDAAKKHGPLIMTNTRCLPWTANGFSASWRKACAAAEVRGVTFHDLRGTAVTRLFLAGCSEAEIATITGHGLHDVRSILDTNYFHRDVALAQSGIAKLEFSQREKERES